MTSRKPSISAIILFLCSGIFLLVVHLGIISPSGIVYVTLIQYSWFFWLSVVFFILSIANLVRRFPQYAGWSTGYSGECVRTVKRVGTRKEHFIRGAPDALLKDVLLDNWPFESKEASSKWQVVDTLRNDVSTKTLESILDTVEVIFSDENNV